MAGSTATGEAHRPIPRDAPSLSDLDLVWIGSSLAPSRDQLDLVGRMIASAHSLKSFHHISLRNLSEPDSPPLPPWLTNSLQPSLAGLSSIEPSALRFAPSRYARFRPLTASDRLEALEFAWRYAALAVALDSLRVFASYVPAKLLLVLAMMAAQTDLGACLPCYRSAVDHVRFHYEGFATALAESYAVKTGSTAHLDSRVLTCVLEGCRALTNRLLPANRTQSGGLALLLHSLPALVLNGQDRYAAAAALSTHLNGQAVCLPLFEAPKARTYLVAAQRLAEILP